jgi:hypothetical protein
LQIESVLATVMVDCAGKLKLMVSPELAVAMAFRSVPGPLSLVLVTVIAVADDGTPPATTSAKAHR